MDPTEGTENLDINNMTDEQLAALSGDELSALRGDNIGEDDPPGDEPPPGDPPADPDPATLDAVLNESDDESRTVPYGRFKEVIEETRDLKLMMRALLEQRGQPAPVATAAPEPPADPEPPQYDLLALNRELAKANSIGDEEKAAELAEQIARANTEIMQWNIDKVRRETERSVLAQVDAREQQREMRTVLKDVYAKFPFLNNEDAKLRDPDIILAVNAKAKQLVAQGKSPPDAVREASETLGSRFMKLITGAGAPVTGKSVDPRVAHAAKVAADAARQGAGPAAGIGARTVGGTLDINKLSDKDIGNLSEVDYDRLIGKDKV